MNKILLIIKREYLTKVKKRSFIVMTILGPILMAALVIIPVYITTRQNEKTVIYVKDDTGLFFDQFENTSSYTFIESNNNVEKTKQSLIQKGDYTLLYIPGTKLNIPDQALIYSNTQPTLNLKEYISSRMSRELEKHKLSAELRKELIKNNPNYSPESDTTTQDLLSETILKNIKTNVNITTIKTDDTGVEKKSFTEVAMGLGYLSSILIYLFIFMFGSQVMNGVIEEKTNRIIEVIVSSVKPFQLMIGKIIGVALVGLTQFLLWIVFTFIIITGVQISFPQYFSNNTPSTEIISQTMVGATESNPSVIPTSDNKVLSTITEAISSINLTTMIISFVLYFLFGYLLYAALFAAIGSAVDNETDSQQFMLPITIPLLIGIMVAQTVIQNPGSSLSFWLSMIPFTSPIIMIVRIPFGVPYWEIALSITLLIAGFLFTTWLAAKIYRTGILMYGKKISYSELWKWIKYKN